MSPTATMGNGDTNMEQRRLHKTLIDYMVIAISPALIMLLVGSLCFFLLTAFYDGEHHLRLTWIFGFFVLGAVMVGRLSIEEGKEYAMLFALPLAGVVCLAVITLFRLNPLLCLMLVAVVWFCAHKLTWDCTVVDEREDASGQGLLQQIGWEPNTDEDNHETQATSDSSEQTNTTWWQQYIARRKRAHTPGVWVVYFSSIALPLFGFGQLLIPGDDAASRNYAFRLLMVFVASALLLLLTTSFLGLRRYLRQRSMEMPTEMASGWLALGGCLIVGLLAFCLLLPRPGPNGSLSNLIAKVGSPEDLINSRFGFGKGEHDEDQATRTDDNGNEFGDGDPSSSSDPQSQTPANHPNAQDTTSNSQASDNSQSDNSQSNQDTAGDSTNNDGSSDKPPSDSNRSQGDSRQSPTDSQPARRNEQQEQQRLENDERNARRRNSPRQRQSKPSPPPPDQNPESSRQQPQQKTNLPSWTELSPLVFLLFKLVLWGCMAAVAGYLLYKNWDKVLAAWQKFRRELAEFWQRWFGQTHTPEDTATGDMVRRQVERPFSSFRDPFADGSIHHDSPAAIVKYSFEALEAWGREHGLPRGEDQTPHEFAQQLAPRVPHMAAETMQLADLYNQAAYAASTVPEATLPKLKAFWHKLAGPPPVATTG